MKIEMGSDGNIALTCQGGNVVSIPWTEKGMAVLHRILSADLAAKQRPTIGEEASPVQYMVERWLVEDAERKAKAHEELISSLKFDL